MGRIKISEIKLTEREANPKTADPEAPLAYEGYLWWSDADRPEVIDGPIAGKLPAEGDNPFVVEGMLYNRTYRLSYSIRFVEGQYIVNEFAVAEEDLREQEEKTYLSNRMDGRWLCFLRYWEEESDPNNYTDDAHPDGLPVLTQTKNVFIGFKGKEESR